MLLPKETVHLFGIHYRQSVEYILIPYVELTLFMIAVGKDGKGDLDHDGTIIGDSKLLKAMLCTAAELQPEVLDLLAYAVKAVTLKKLSDTLKNN